MSEKYIEVRRSGPVTTFVISRPQAMNSLPFPAHFEFSRHFDEFSADPDQWVAIVTGAGDRAFCAGNDLKQEIAPGEEMSIPSTGFGGLTGRFDLDKPVIAAVNGVAMGGGFELALACDLIIASENAAFAVPEVKVGLAALAGGILRLPAHVGRKRAMDLILTGRRVTAREGFDFGFVNEVVPAGEALSAAERWAQTICQNSPTSLRASKAILRRALDVALAEAMQAHLDYPEVLALLGIGGRAGRPARFRRKASSALDGALTAQKDLGRPRTWVATWERIRFVLIGAT